MLLPEFAKPLFDIFEQEGEELYLVGGAVRDWMIHQLYDYNGHSDHAFETKDLDFATSAWPEKTKSILNKHGFTSWDVGIKFGTIGTHIDDVKCDITTYRTRERYKPGSRKPDVEFGNNLLDDLKRRDFNINAMALDSNGKRIDNFDGVESLSDRVMCTPGDPVTAFTDDPLRMIRMYRFWAQVQIVSGGAEIDAVKKLKHLIHTVSVERIFDEMSKLLMADDPCAGLHGMADSGLLGEVFPELQVVIDFKQNQGKYHSKLVWPHTLEVVQNTPQILAVRWAALFHDVAKPETYSETDTGVHFFQHDFIGARKWLVIAERLKVSNEFKEEVRYLIHDHLRLAHLATHGVENVTDKTLRRLIRDAGPYFDNLFHLSLSDITSKRPDTVAKRVTACLALKGRCDALETEHSVTTVKLPKGFGIKLAAALGIKPGPELGKQMQVLQHMLEEGSVTNDENALIAQALAMKEEEER